MAKRNKRKKKNSRFENSFENNILSLFTKNPGKSYNYKQIARQLVVKKAEEKKLIYNTLLVMSEKKVLTELSPGKFKLNVTASSVVGKVEIAQAGYGFLVSEEMEDDIFISQKNLQHALHGDVVKVNIFARRRNKGMEGEVLEIIERNRTTFVGNIEISERYAFLVPDSRKMPYDIFVPIEKLGGAENGQKVIVKITDWPQKAKNPFGEVIEVLGNPGENETEIHAILAEFGLPYHFPEDVDNAAHAIASEITDEDLANRRDFRKITTFTIDPDDAKDFDDALSIQKLSNGNWEVGVHIADVTHYVHTKSIIEQEAQERATSVYLVDRVVPMLPERLSNFICSLRPHEEKLCFSAVFELNDKGELFDEWFGRTIIYSDRRFTYAEAQAVIDTGEGDYKEELLKMNDLAQKLRADRYKKGAISFDREEVKFEIDEKGKPLSVFFREHGLSNELVEEFMLLANKQVANFIGNVEDKKERKTFVYRIHDKPDLEKLEKFNAIIARFGHSIAMHDMGKLSQGINQLLANVEGKPEQNLVETLAIRSMAKAVYSSTNIGHYGLAFKHYTHFTSPIRRYPDMMVHRLLNHYLTGGSTKSKTKIEEQCKHSSQREQLAAEAERASIKFKQVEFMSDKIGQVFEGIISGVSEFGIFVEINENKCEGLVSTRELQDDFFEFDDENYCLVGRHTHKIYQLGDKVSVEILRANLVKKQLDFALVEPEVLLDDDDD